MPGSSHLSGAPSFFISSRTQLRAMTSPYWHDAPYWADRWLLHVKQNNAACPLPRSGTTQQRGQASTGHAMTDARTPHSLCNHGRCWIPFVPDGLGARRLRRFWSQAFIGAEALRRLRGRQTVDRSHASVGWSSITVRSKARPARSGAALAQRDGPRGFALLV